MRVMVTGGAGYIGGHIVSLLAARGDHVVVADDLVTGRVERVTGIPLIPVDLASDDAADTMATAFRKHSIDSVIHLAARKQVGESFEKPAWYYGQNIGGLANLLQAMERAGVGELVFSSSAAVYGDAVGAVAETEPAAPINPYGETKLVGEGLIAASTRAWGLRAASLRYFNVAGAGRPELGDTEALNLVPLVFERLDADEPPVIFGDDYDTVDGTCIRDYVHVLDVAEAHLAILDSLPTAVDHHRILNVGTGIGTSVREMVDAITAVAGVDVVPEIRGRRAGDAPYVIAAVNRIREETGWRARFGFEDIVRSAWTSHEYFAKR